MTNRLAQETSPYLQQHKENPVDWYPWGAEALAKARAEDKPIFLSIGYSACHWCHVMEHESFEDAAVADLLNRGFVPVKVDREERPDIDSIYMGAVQALTGQGGWPLNVFLTPDLKPFYGGTYWPPVDGMGLPAFPKVLEAIADAWANRREGLEENAEQVGTFLSAANTAEPKRDVLSLDVLDEAFEALEPAFDDLHGGFGSAPKFPQPPVLEFLLRTHKRKPSKSTARMITTTLDQMMQGGMYDQIGGGFHRYSVDRQWIVPHFEKMLYDNGQLARIYLDGFRLTGDEQYGRHAEDILDSLLGSMVDPSGGIWSAEDADTEGEEGKFYVWTTEEAREALAGTGVAVDAVLDLYGITEGGNFEGHSIPTRAEPLETVAGRHGLTLDDLTMQAATARAALKHARAHRTKPGIDQKILASWNGLVLRSLAEVGRARKRPDFLAAANVLALSLREGSDNWKDLRHYTTYGQPGVPGYLEDYANVADGLLALYQATGDPNWLEGARLLIDDMLERFSGPENGLLFDSQEAHEPLVTRARDIQDGPTPSGNAVAAEVLIKASHLTGDRRHLERAEQILARLVRPMAEQPQGFGRALTALDTYLATPKEVVIAGPRDAESTAAMLDAVFAVYEPAAIVALAEPGGVVDLRLLESRAMRDGQVTGYVCERFACLPPTTDAEELQRMLVKGTGVSWSEL